MIEFLFVLMALAALIWTSLNVFRSDSEETAAPATSETTAVAAPPELHVDEIDVAPTTDGQAENSEERP